MTVDSRTVVRSAAPDQSERVLSLLSLVKTPKKFVKTLQARPGRIYFVHGPKLPADRHHEFSLAGRALLRCEMRPQRHISLQLGRIGATDPALR